jgi:hypothetical protein
MIENIRKYRGLIIFALVLVVIALVFGFKEDLFNSGGGGRPMYKIAGRTYDDNEYRNLGANSLQLTMALMQSGNMEVFPFLRAMTGTSFEDPEKFFIGRMILRDAKKELGVYPDQQEVFDHIKGMRMFADKDGKFNPEAYTNFVERYLGQIGLSEADLQDLVSDMLASEKIGGIIGSGLSANRDMAAKDLALSQQQIDGEIARLDIDPYQDKIQPTDEEIKTYWEAIQDQFKTEPLRKFSYLIATPDMPVDPEADAEKKDEKESLADAAATDEAKKKKEAEKAKKAAEFAEAKRKKQLEIDEQMDEFATKLEDQQGEGFEDLVKEFKLEVKTTELFPQSKPPAELDVKLRASSRGGNAVDELFRINITSDPLSKLSQPIAIGENQWLVARLDGEEKSRNKTWEEAKDEARAQYIAEKGAEALKKATQEAYDKIKASLAAGKSFADAAKEAGINETKAFTKITASSTPDTASEPRTLFANTKSVDPGSLAEIVTEADRSFILFVSKREVVKQENAEAMVDGQVKQAATMNESNAYSGWIAAKIEEAKVVQLFRQ